MQHIANCKSAHNQVETTLKYCQLCSVGFFSSKATCSCNLWLIC